MPQLLRVFAPLIQHLAGYSQLLPLPVIRDRYAHKLERAGLGFELSADEFLAIKVMTALVMIVVAFITYTLLVHSWLVVLALIATGFMLPDMRLSAAVARQERAYLRSLPGFLDLLALSVEAGLSFDSAVRRLTEILEPGPLIQGFQTYLRNTNIGKSRADALREMARKADLPDLTAFTNAVIQATETGASMGQVLRTESHEMLLRRFERAEKAAYELPVKILFPLFAFVFPATFLMILGPLYFQFKASGAGGIF
ncbi:MAG: type II secretion system F family protein [candidate division WOR-3 bacterium]